MRRCFFCVAGSLVIASAVFAQPTALAGKAAAVDRRQITAGIRSAKTEVIAPNRATLSVALEQDVAAKMKLHDWTGKEIVVSRTPDGVIKAEVDPQRSYLLVSPARERQMLRKDGLQFPARYVTFAPGGATKLGGLFLRPAVVPLTWDEKARAYVTEIFVGYEFDDGAERAIAPKTVTFFAEGSNARIEADSVRIERSGGAGYQRVVLSTAQTEGETHFTARASPVDELKTSVTVLREPGGIQLSLPSTELPAFGVGSAALTVSLIGRDGMPLGATRPFEVQLSSRRLHQPSAVVIESGKSTATADVRTTGYGADEIVAQSGVFRATLPIKLMFPIAPIVAALVGGVLGGSARYLRNKRKRAPLLLRRIVEGMLVGTIVVGAAWAGLVSADLGTGIFGTPFGAFVLAALSGYLGCVVLDRVAKKTFG